MQSTLKLRKLYTHYGILYRGVKQKGRVDVRLSDEVENHQHQESNLTRKLILSSIQNSQKRITSL